MIKYNNTNNASTTLTAGISPSSTTLIVENGDILPTVPFLLTLEHFDNEKVTVREIVKCIAKVGTILTIQRGAGTCVQDDTATPKAQNNTPHSFSVGDSASIYWTSEQVKDIQDAIDEKLNISDFQAGTYVYGATSTGTDAYAITIPGTVSSYAVGQVFKFMADVANEGNATLNVNGLGAVEIKKNHDQHLQTGDIEAGQIVEVAYDGTAFQMNSQVATVISLDDISSLSYNDTTCYAGEEIHENDLIVTNGNSFNPDRTDESTDVGGTTVNKYAIGFIGNGESADTFSIKTSVIEGFTPDSVTINIESDDNGKPSGTALATSTSLNSLKGFGIDLGSLVGTSITSNDRNNIGDFFFNVIGEDATFSSGILSSNSVSLDFSGFTGAVQLYSISNDDKYFIFLNESRKPNPLDSNIITVIYTPNRYSVEGATVLCSLTFADLRTALGWGTSGRLYNITYDETGTKIIASGKGVAPNTTWTCANLTTPFDLTTIANPTNILVGNYRGETLGFMKTQENKYGVIGHIYNSNSSSYSYSYVGIQEIDMDTFTLVGSVYTAYRYFMEYKQIRYDKDKNPFFYITLNNSGTYTYDLVRLGSKFSTTPCKSKITFSSPATTTKGTKYRLTIAPVVTGSVVDSVKIYDKEGEYYSECAVNDTNNVRSNVSNKTPYIDSSCIQARYGRKINPNDVISITPCGFANGDFTGLEQVNYCFQGIKSGFNGLEKDTAYYSDGSGGITTENVGDIVGKSINGTDLIVDFCQKSTDKSFIMSTGGTKEFTPKNDEIMLCSYKGTLQINNFAGSIVRLRSVGLTYPQEVVILALKRGEKITIIGSTYNETTFSGLFYFI